MKKRKYSWMDCIRNYRFHSIFLKNLFLISLVFILPFCCVIGVSYYAYNQIRESEEKAHTDEIRTMIYKDVDSLFRELRDKMIMTTYEEDVQMFYRTKLEQKKVYYDLDNIMTFLELFILSTEFVDDIYLYAPNSNNVVASSFGLSSYDNFFDKVSIDCWQDNGEKYQFAYLERVVSRQVKKHLCIYYTIPYTPDCTGVVIVLIDMGKIEKILDYGEGVSLAMVGNGQVLFDSAGIRTGMAVENTDELVQILEQENEGTTQKKLVVYNELEQGGLELVLLIYNKSLDAKMHNISIFLIVFVSIMVLITIVVGFYISWRIFNPITEVMRALEETPEKGERILQNENEISYIRNSIYATISRNKDVEQELLERISLLKKAQAVALQAQINPHFINNTLETINCMTILRLGSGNEISEMLSYLSQLMRISLKDTDTFVTLEEEIKYVEIYLLIQQKRLEGRFDVVFDIPKELMSCKVIKMVLQPVVENAINYGIIPYDSKGKLRIAAVKTADKVCISVRDSGLGIPQEKTDEINASIRSTVIKESTHIGLNNVNQRLILAFGEEYGVTLQSRIGSGTTVLLDVPYQI